MLARNETIFKWALYSAAALLCLAVQSAFLQRITIWGVIPFLYPLLAAIPATWEAPRPGSIFSLAMGVLCDQLLPGPIPCFYTLIFPVIGLLAALISRSLLPAGFLCSLTVSAMAFLLTDLFHCVLFLANETLAWSTALSLFLRELLVTAPLVIPVTLLFRAVARKTQEND